MELVSRHTGSYDWTGFYSANANTWHYFWQHCGRYAMITEAMAITGQHIAILTFNQKDFFAGVNWNILHNMQFPNNSKNGEN